MLQQSAGAEAAPAFPGELGPSCHPMARHWAPGSAMPDVLVAHLYRLSAPASVPQISSFSGAEMELEVGDKVILEKGTPAEVTPPQRIF